MLYVPSLIEKEIKEIEKSSYPYGYAKEILANPRDGHQKKAAEVLIRDWDEAEFQCEVDHSNTSDDIDNILPKLFCDLEDTTVNDKSEDKEMSMNQLDLLCKLTGLGSEIFHGWSMSRARAKLTEILD